MAGQWRGPSVWRSPYTRGEAEQFKALAELGHQANLGDTIGADLSWFEKEDQSKTFRSISATQHLNPRNLTAEGGVFALLCHQLRESIQQYLEERKSKQCVAHPSRVFHDAHRLPSPMAAIRTQMTRSTASSLS